MARRKIPTKPSVTVYTPQVRRGIPEFPSISRSIPELKIPSLSKVYNTPAFFFHLTSIIVILAIVYQGVIGKILRRSFRTTEMDTLA
jgi:hypothetical protein